MKEFCINNGWIQITNRCNLKCKYCYMDANKNLLDLSFSRFEEIIKKFQVLGIRNVMLSGGEPCLHRDIVKMITYLSEHGLKVGLVTNGTICSQELLQCLEENSVTVQVSVDSVEQEGYFYSRGVNKLETVLKIIKKMQEKNIELSLSNTLNNYTIEKVNTIVNYALENRIHTLHFCFLIPSDRCKRNNVNMHGVSSVLRELYKIQISNYTRIQIGVIENYVRSIGIDKKICCFCNSMAGKNIEVLPNGDIYQCGAMESKLSECPRPNIFELSLEELQNVLSKFIKKTGVDILSTCKECDVKNICRGGCRAISYQVNGSLLGEQPLCHELHDFLAGVVKDYNDGLLNDYLTYLKLIDKYSEIKEHDIRYF